MTLCLYVFLLQVDEALMSEDIEVVLEVVEELVQATAEEDTPQLPQDLDTSNDIITDTLDLFFNNLESADDTNATIVQVDVRYNYSSLRYTTYMYTVCSTCIYIVHTRANYIPPCMCMCNFMYMAHICLICIMCFYFSTLFGRKQQLYLKF